MDRKVVRQMIRASIFALTVLVLAACKQEESADTRRVPERSRGKAIIFRSNVDRHVMALYPDEGSLGFYGDVSEVGGPSDLGGRLKQCGEGISKCVEVADSIYFMAPPGGGDWIFRGYDFHVDAGLSDRKGHVVVVSRAGKESYSYGYSPRCGVEWINFSTGKERGERVYYPIGRSLFSELSCTPILTN